MVQLVDPIRAELLLPGPVKGCGINVYLFPLLRAGAGPMERDILTGRADALRCVALDILLPGKSRLSVP